MRAVADFVLTSLLYILMSPLLIYTEKARNVRFSNFSLVLSRNCPRGICALLRSRCGRSASAGLLAKRTIRVPTILMRTKGCDSRAGPLRRENVANVDDAVAVIWEGEGFLQFYTQKEVPARTGRNASIRTASLLCLHRQALRCCRCLFLHLCV